jgi:hypothetical protein
LSSGNFGTVRGLGKLEVGPLVDFGSRSFTVSVEGVDEDDEAVRLLELGRVSDDVLLNEREPDDFLDEPTRLLVLALVLGALGTGGSPDDDGSGAVVFVKYGEFGSGVMGVKGPSSGTSLRLRVLAMSNKDSGLSSLST